MSFYASNFTKIIRTDIAATISVLAGAGASEGKHVIANEGLQSVKIDDKSHLCI
ncbi:MAG: hypothetical protein QNK51_00135 [Chitinophagales bacterium]